MTAQLEARFQEGVAHHQRGDFAQAERVYRDVLTQAPQHSDALHMLGLIGLQTGHFKQAAVLIGQACALNPANPGAHGNHGIALRALGRHEEALASYDKALALQPAFAEILNNRAVTLSDLERFEAAVADCDQAIKAKPDYAEAYNNRGNALRALWQHDAARASYQAAIRLKPEYAEAFNNRGLVLDDVKQFGAALASYGQAVQINPTYAEAYNNRANAFRAVGRHAEALADYDKAIQINPGYADAHYNRGHALDDAKRYAEALSNYDAAYHLQPQKPFLTGTRFFTRLMICDWRDIEAEAAETARRVMQGEKAATPFPILVATDNAAVQRRAAEVWAQVKHPAQGDFSAAPRKAGKIRVGYFSMDFRNHPIATLTAGLFEAHDRGKFEIYGFSYGPDTQDDMQKRLKGAFDHFVDVRALTDAEIATRAREMGIDIAVDLAGYTNNARTGIFAQRAAQVQVNYLGYPGTMGAPYIDYIVADDVVIPPTARAQYDEKIVSLPCFQVNDDKREAPSHNLSRAELGLPQEGFVFCCFNNTYKINPRSFGSWMRIMHSVKDSVLFLYADAEGASANLRKEAAVRGIDADRLIFGKRLPMQDYLARYKAADLFLDTLPYNAGTTAADALWMGLPVLTCTGEAFASRMAASLLHALDLQELITRDAAEYENLAVALALEPARMSRVKAKLAQARTSSRLFDTAYFAAKLETAYTLMWQRHQAGQPPDYITIAP